MLKHSFKYLALNRYINRLVTLSDKEFQDIANYFKPQKLAAGAYFCYEGEICNEIIFLTKGYMRVYYDINDMEVTSYVAQRHSVVTAFASFTSREPSRESIQAITDCEMLVIDYQSMQMLYERYPQWQELGRLIMEHVYQHTEKRVLSFLAQSAEERYRDLLEEQPRLVKHVPLRYIASMLGITPETLSRVRNKIHGERAISLRM